MLAKVDRALTSSGNSQTIGRNGELPLKTFLSRHLPNTLTARSGHFVSPSGQLSPQIDILITDSRYPLLAENEDGSVLAMLHSVLSCIEVKTNIRTTDLAKIRINSETILDIAENSFSQTDKFENISCVVFAYRSASRLDALADEFFDVFVDDTGHTDLYVLRVPKPDQVEGRDNGVEFHLEPPFPEQKTDEWNPTVCPMYTPLSDFYYRLIQDSYYWLNYRNLGFGDIGEQIMKYMSWSTIHRK